VQALTKLEGSPLLVKYLSLLIGLVVVLAFGVRPALKKAVSAARSTPRELAGIDASGQTAQPRPESALPDPSRVRAQEVFEQVSRQLKQEPAQTSRLLQSWIHSE
jgi:flagellar M-ring protein FliF